MQSKSSRQPLPPTHPQLRVPRSQLGPASALSTGAGESSPQALLNTSPTAATPKAARARRRHER
jgi:hypothetical protein